MKEDLPVAPEGYKLIDRPSVLGSALPPLRFELSSLVVRRAKEFRSRVTYAFDEELARGLFDDSQRVLALFEQVDPADWVGDEHVLAVLRAAGRLPPEQDGSVDDQDD